MKNCISNILPDNLTGAVFAVEGIRDACVIMNGPTGCKYYHSAVSDEQFVRSLSFDPLSYPEEFYFGQPRVPATYLDGHDYVYGSKEKLLRILKSIAQKKYSLIAVINSPGAALIGDDLEQFLKREIHEIPCFAVENSGFSGSFGKGYQNAIIKAFEHIHLKKRSVMPKTVNLLGMCIQQKYYDHNIGEMKRLLELCGIKVVTTPGALDTVETLQSVTAAEINVVVYPEYGNEIAYYLKDSLAMDYMNLTEGPPIGFDASEAFIKDICERLNVDQTPAIEEINRVRARSYLYLARYASLLGLPKGAFFSIKAETSVAYTLSKWLVTYLGMIPSAIELLDDQDNEMVFKLKELLKNMGCEAALGNLVNQTKTQIVFADGSTISQLKLEEVPVCGMEIALPGLGYLDIVEKTLFGPKGALFILENIMNGLRFI
ncbi:MAG: nitrogenase component 1 [Eubacterium sp.]